MTDDIYQGHGRGQSAAEFFPGTAAPQLLTMPSNITNAPFYPFCDFRRLNFFRFGFLQITA